MSDLLLDVPPEKPKWKELAEKHGIFSHYSEHMPDGTEWSAWAFHVLESDYAKDWRKREPMDLIGEYCALIDERGGEADAPTEREAVITLIHRLKLDGWREVSL